MQYQNSATSVSQALIVFLIDISGSMKAKMPNGKERHEVVEEALQRVISRLAQQSFDQGEILPRYRLNLIAYSEEIWDIYGGIKTIGEVVERGLTELPPQTKTDPAKAFRYVKNVLEEDIKSWSEDSKRYCPPPMIIHLTDAEITERFEDPEPIVKEIQKLAVPDGNVLVNNIFISEYIKLPTNNIQTWKGFFPEDKTGDQYGDKLLRLSSRLPETYRDNLNTRQGTNLSSGTVMFYPGIDPEFIESGFVASMSSYKIRRKMTGDEERIVYKE